LRVLLGVTDAVLSHPNNQIRESVGSIALPVRPRRDSSSLVRYFYKLGSCLVLVQRIYGKSLNGSSSSALRAAGSSQRGSREQLGAARWIQNFIYY
jgi:hypothetical protein